MIGYSKARHNIQQSWNNNRRLRKIQKPNIIYNNPGTTKGDYAKYGGQGFSDLKATYFCVATEIRTSKFLVEIR